MVNDHSNSVREKTCCHLYMKAYFDYQPGKLYMHHPTDKIAHTMAFLPPVMEHWLQQERAQWVNHE